MTKPLITFLAANNLQICTALGPQYQFTFTGPNRGYFNIKRACDALKNDPFVKHYKPWQDAIHQLLDLGVRAEQQAFAVHDLNYVINDYLPQKLRKAKAFLS